MDRRQFIVLGTAGSVAVFTGCGGSGGGGGVATPPTGTAPPPACQPASNFDQQEVRQKTWTD